jgi:1,2-diacylglycerol 3-beta-galactosyltransferase
MPRVMTGADMIVTKAGPATITEAAMAGLPMIIYDAIPGQEDGNVTYVVDNEAGAFAPDPEEAANTVASWLREGTEALQRRSQNARRIVNPNAVWEIADEVWKWAQHPFIPGRVTRRFWRFRRRSSRS